MNRHPLHGIDLSAPGGVEALLAFHRATFGDVRMEVATLDREAILAEYRALSEDDLAAERETLATVLASEDATDEDATRADVLADVIGERNAAVEAANARRERLAGLEVARRSPARTAPRGGPERERTPLTLGERLDWADITERFTTSASFQRFLDDNCHGRASFDVPDLMTRAVITTADIPSTPTALGLRPLNEFPLSILDLVSTSTIGTNSVSWVVDASVDNDLINPKNPVAEGAAKPEAAFDFNEFQANAQTIAGWVAVTRQTLEDNSTLQGYLSGRLTRKVRYALANEVLNGNGTGGRLQGILPIAAAVPAGADPFASIAAGIAQVESYLHTVNGIVINPADWSQFMTAATSGTYGNQVNPFAATQKSIWGQTVITDPMIPAGTALVGDFTEDTLFFRSNVTLLVADQHADLFIKNTLLLLAECRVINVVFDSTAFAKVTLTGA